MDCADRADRHEPHGRRRIARRGGTTEIKRDPHSGFIAMCRWARCRRRRLADHRRPGPVLPLYRGAAQIGEKSGACGPHRQLHRAPAL